MTFTETIAPLYQFVIEGRRVEAASAAVRHRRPYLGAPWPARPTAPPRTSTPRWPRFAGRWLGHGASSPGSAGPL